MFLVMLGLVALTLFLTQTSTVHANPAIIYVDVQAPGPVHDGNWWTTDLPYTDGCAEHRRGRQRIWVADGVYTPTNTADRTATFSLKPDVALYGGFGGYGISETQRAQRDWTTYQSILSGDLDGNDLNTDGNFIAEVYSDTVGNNAYHVVTGNYLPTTAVLDGFIITAGYANGSHPDSDGGGLSNYQSSPTLSNLTFSGNQAVYGGGGLSNFAFSSPTLSNLTFSGNRAVYGGGLYNDNYSSPTLNTITFTGNQALSGGGLYNHYRSDPMLTNITFSGNQADWGGGGMHNYNLSSPTLVSVSFSANQAAFMGAGLYNDNESSPTLINVTFRGNQAIDGDGGGMYNHDRSNAVLNNVRL